MKANWSDPVEPSQTYEELGQTLPSTYSSPPALPRKPSVPAAVRRIVAELGLRYRPTPTADLTAHAEALSLLAFDIADLQPERLERAVTAWVRAERWMPKASELIALYRRDQRDKIEGRCGNTSRPMRDETEAFYNTRNAALASEDHPRHRDGLEWYVDDTHHLGLRYRQQTG